MIGSLNLGQTTYKSDGTSHLRSAGAGAACGMSAKDCMTWQERPATPDSIKKYRQSTLHTPGAIYRHFGAADDNVDNTKVYGKAGGRSEGVTACLASYPQNDMQRWTLERSEDVYHSTAREPLGRGWRRGHRIPDGLGTAVPFGKKSEAPPAAGGSLARACIAPVDSQPEDPDDPGTRAHALYTKSHGAYAPGEQRRRDYDWAAAGVDVRAHRFGAAAAGAEPDGVRKALNPALDARAPREPAVVPHRLEQHRLCNDDVLGRSRRLGGGDVPLPDGFSFGKPSLPKGVREEGVGELLAGHYSPAEQQPDADLGRSLRPGFRNDAPPGRVFGVPSVRTDLPPPAAPSVANVVNYGSEADAAALLSPCATADRGVHEAHYLQRLSRAAVRGALEGAGIEMGEDAFEACFAAAARGEGGGDATSLKAFMDCRHWMLQRQAGL